MTNFQYRNSYSHFTDEGTSLREDNEFSQGYVFVVIENRGDSNSRWSRDAL